MKPPVMSAEDILPLVQQLPRDERMRLVKLVLAAEVDADAYRECPPNAEEFGKDDDGMRWDAEGWDEFKA